jgi:hypothetical protein
MLSYTSLPRLLHKAILILLLIGIITQLRVLLLHTHATPSPQKYQAPLRCSSNPEERSPGSYMVYLSYYHSMEQHLEAVKRDLTPYVKDVYEQLYAGRVVYSVVRVDDELLGVIRGDEKVMIVECAVVLGA